MYSSDTSWIMTVAYSCLITIQTNTATLIHIAKEKQKKHEWSSNTTTSLIFLSFTKAPGFYQVYVYLSCFSSDSLNRSIGNSPDFSVKNSGDHLPPPLIPRNPCWHPNRKSPWPWTSQRVRRWWPSPPWHLGSFVPRGFSRDPYMVEMWRW